MTDTRPPTSAIVFRAFVCLVLVGIGAGIAGALVATRADAGRNPDAAPAPRIAVLEVAAVPVERFVRGYGTARPLDSADVPARVAAVVATLSESFAPGSRVEKGQPLLTLDASDFLRQVEVAEQALRGIDAQMRLLEAQERAASQSAELADSDRELAAADLARVEKAAAEGAAQPREIDRARQTLIAATRAAVAADDALAQIAPRRQALVAQRASEEARLALARLSAERCTVLAPIAGILQEADLEVGESVAPGQRIARIVDRARLEVPLRIPASARALAPAGARSTVVARDAAMRYDGVVARVAPEDDPESRTTTVFIEIAQDPSKPAALAPGAFVEARIASGGVENRVAIPRRAIRDERIAVVENGRVRMRRVSVDYRLDAAPAGAAVADSDWAVLDEALPDGTLVVLDGSRSLAEGQAVEPVRAERVAGAAR